VIPLRLSCAAGKPSHQVQARMFYRRPASGAY
jgi:hypothetical protein